MKINWKRVLIAGLCLDLLLVAIPLLIYPNHAAAQKEKREIPSAIGGRGAQSDAETFRPLRMSAEQGNMATQFFLGSRYADGRGVTQDYVQAYMWWDLAAAGTSDKRHPNFQKAVHLRDSIAKKMTPQQIEEAKRLAKEWESRYVQKMGAGPFIAAYWGVAAPVVLAGPNPSYTDDARKHRISGDVLINCIVRKDGTMDSFKILKGLGYGLDESAIKTITEKWRFKPGTFQGKPVDVRANIPITFRLK